MKHIISVTMIFFVSVSQLHATKRALIFGITGQDGYYLTELLLNKGYQVHGVSRNISEKRAARLNRLVQEKYRSHEFFLHWGDINDPNNVKELINKINPDEIYNLAAQSNVKISFEAAFITAQTNALGTLNILEAIRLTNPTIRFYQASSSEMFGKTKDFPQNEHTPFKPESPYGIAKLYAYWITVNYRKAYGMYACNGILFNHESPLRDEIFVTKKITRSVARIYYRLQDTLYLGNLNAKRDWGYAKDYVQAMWLMLQQDTPDDYVIATGEIHSVKEFVECAFKKIGIDLIWQGTGIDEQGLDSKTDKVLVAIDPAYFRPTEIECTVGDATKAINKLKWHRTINFSTLVSSMVEYDLAEIKKENIDYRI